MATRNLTVKFQKLRRENRRTGPETGHDDWEQARRTLPPYWVDTVDECRIHIDQISEKMQELENTHNKRLRVFTDSEEAKLESEIDIITGQITGLFRKTERNLKRIFQTNIQQQSTHDDQIRKNIQSSMAKQLQDYSFQFRGIQKAYMSKLKEKKQGAESAGFFSSSDAASTDAPVDTGFNDMQLEMLRNYEKDVNQRDQEIAAIAKSIEELATIFKELSVLVIDQGTILDRIDYNMEIVVDKVEQGVVELEKAVKYQKSSRPLWCIVVLLIANAVMILLLYFKFKKDDKGGSDGNSGGRMLRGLGY
jgi:syntaxin 16